MSKEKYLTSLIVALLIWLPIVLDDFLLSNSVSLVKVVSIGESSKGFSLVQVKENNHFPALSSISYAVAKRLQVGDAATIYKSHLFERVLEIEVRGKVYSNVYNGGINLIIRLGNILLAFYIGYNAHYFLKAKK